jgi:hypothetical protein
MVDVSGPESEGKRVAGRVGKRNGSFSQLAFRSSLTPHNSSSSFPLVNAFIFDIVRLVIVGSNIR